MATPVGQEIHLPRRANGRIWTPDRSVAPPPPPPGQGWDYDFGTIPFAWNLPAAPEWDDEIEVTNNAELTSALATPRRRIVIRPGTYTAGFALSRADQEIEVDNAAFITGSFSVAQSGQERTRIRGGNFHNAAGEMFMNRPRDLLFYNMNIITRGMNIGVGFFGLWSERMAIINCTVDARLYAVLHSSRGGSDFTVANSYFRAGTILPQEFGIRVAGTQRAVLVDNYVTVGGPSTDDTKNCYRWHNGTDFYYARNNIGVGDGWLIASRAGTETDVLPNGRGWVLDNRMYYPDWQTRPLFAAFRNNSAGPAAVGPLVASGNIYYNDVPPAVGPWAFNSLAGDSVSNNTALPYQAPPSPDAWGADH